MQNLRQAYFLTQLLWKQERADLRLAVFNSLVLPLTLFYYGTRLHAGNPSELAQFMAGAVTMSLAMAAMSQVGITIVSDRFSGRLTTLVYVSRSRLAYFVARNVIAVVQGVLVTVGSLIVLGWIGVAQIAPVALGTAALAGALGAMAIGGLGAVIGIRARSAEGGEAALAISAIALSLVTPVFYSVSDSAAPVQAIAMLSPLTSVSSVMASLLRAEPPATGALIGMIVSALVWTALAYRKFEWK
ncbi:MAG TPA: ABC transporter permease [Kofleriaceae bacterium]|nr:ABC transporter permease [Kofleriaceae bacterium]